ncbi:MAG: carbohydrate ABC transporter permease [Oscillospiraceae bacterium]|nr:carbohydrate ABC transporter permease [Oscillospiraceae bacterium]
MDNKNINGLNPEENAAASEQQSYEQQMVEYEAQMKAYEEQKRAYEEQVKAYEMSVGIVQTSAGKAAESAAQADARRAPESRDAQVFDGGEASDGEGEDEGEYEEEYDEALYGSFRTTYYVPGASTAAAGFEAQKLSKAEIKEVDRRNKEIRKKYHVSNMQILKNYRNYSEEEQIHYRYLFGRRVAETVWPIFNYVILIGLAFVIMYPIMFMISNSIRPQIETTDPSIVWIPRTLRFENFSQAFESIVNHPRNEGVIFNTFFINIGASIIQVAVCALTGYGFARFKFKGRNLLFGIVILQMIVPVQVIMIPLYMQFRYFDIFGIFGLINGEPLNLIGNPATMFIMAFFVNGVRAGLFVLLFRQFFRGLPKELEDAAYLDGCGPFATFMRIMVPNSLVGFLTVFIFSVVWYWNETYITSMLMEGTPTIALTIESLWETIAYNKEINPSGRPDDKGAADFITWVHAGCLIAITPLLVMYTFLQKHFVEGVERSGIVG